MEIIQKTPEKLVIRMDANETLANALRRSVSEVPTLAVDEVEIFKNDSALYDEIISHRLGLVPLKTEKGMSAKTKVDLKLVKEGPCTVYSGDLKGNAEVVFDKIPITILGEGHTLELVATAALGKGVTHAKHVPGLCYYRHIQEVKSSPQTDAVVQKVKGLVKPEKKGNTWLCDLTEAQVQDIIKDGKDSVKDSSEILFVIESYGQMDAKDILLNSLKMLEENVEEFNDSFK